MAGNRKAAALRVSDHAVFRWLQRSGTVDVEQVRAMLAGALDRAFQVGAAMDVDEFIVISGGMVFLIRDRVVVTVTEEDSRHGHARLLSRKTQGQG